MFKLILTLSLTLLSSYSFAAKCKKFVIQDYDSHPHYRNSAETEVKTLEDCVKETQGWADDLAAGHTLSKYEGNWYVEYEFIDHERGRSTSINK